MAPHRQVEVSVIDGTDSSSIGSLRIASSIPTGATRLTTAVTTYAMIEFLAVAASAFLAGDIYHHFVLRVLTKDSVFTFGAISIAVLVLGISLGFQNFSAVRRQTRHKFLWKGFGAVVLAFSIFVTILVLTQWAGLYSRATLILQLVAVAATVVVARTIFESWLQAAIAAQRIEARKVVLIGDPKNFSKFQNRLTANGIKTVGALRFPENLNLKDSADTDRTLPNMISEIRSLRPDDIIVLANNEVLPKMFDYASALAVLPAGIHIVPVDELNSLASLQIVDFGHLKTIQVHPLPLSKFDLFIKRAFDLVFAIVGLIVLSPLCLIVSIAIKFDSPGPVLFRQKRHGYNDEEINVFKFRSMTVTEDGSRFTQAVKDDPRVTRVGYIMRRTNIDELPQLLNVLRGDMSLVGPRPHAIAHNAFFKNAIAPLSRRHNVKPGITGWAQVSGCRGSTDALEKMERRVEHDLYYIDNWSFMFDIKIIMMTLFSKAAYLNAY